MKKSLSLLLRIFGIMAFLISVAGFALPKTAYAADYRLYADTAASKLATFYNTGTGLWPGGWWQSANQLTTLIDYMTRGGSNDYSSMIANTYDKNNGSNFINNFTDDTGWWGLERVRKEGEGVKSRGG
jgi:hypothetical protein